jgi:hypothetical protein
MSVIVVVGAILVTTASVNSLWERRRHDSLERHEKALAALRDLAEHPREPPPEPPPPPPTDHVHILSEPPADAAAHHRRVQKAAAARRAAERRRPRDVSTRPTAAQLPTMPTHGALAPQPEREPAPPVTADTMPVVIDPPPRPEPHVAPAAARHAVSTRHVPARVIGAGAAALLVIIAVTTAAVVAGRSGSPKRATAAVTPTSVPVAAPAPKTTVAPPAPPPDIQVVASAQGNGTVTVTVPYTLTLTAGGLCWVSVTSDSGQTLYEGTLRPGQQQHVTSSGPLTVRLGNTPAMQISVNGRPLVLAGVAKTANVRFIPPT